METVVTRAIRGRNGVIAVARRDLQLPFVPSIGMVLLYGDSSVVVKEVVLDLELQTIAVVDEDDRDFASLAGVTREMIVAKLAGYTERGWRVSAIDHF